VTEYPACINCHFYVHPRCYREPPKDYMGNRPNINDPHEEWCGEYRIKEGPAIRVEPPLAEPEAIELAPPVPGPDPVSLPFAQAPTGKKKRT